MKCPRCQTHELIGIMDVMQPDITMAACPNCSYYQSNSEAYATSPASYCNMGNETLARTDLYGLTYGEIEGWLETEQAYTKRIATPIPTKRRRRVTLRKVTSRCRLVNRFLSAVTNRLVATLNIHSSASSSYGTFLLVEDFARTVVSGVCNIERLLPVFWHSSSRDNGLARRQRNFHT